MYYAAPHSSRIHYGAAAADTTAASLHTKKTHHAPSLHPAAAAAAAPTYLHHHYEAAASSSRYAHSAVAPHRTSTPVRSTTPVRCVTPSRPTKPSSSGAVAAAHASTPSSSSFMTQAARGDVTPKAQISRAPSHAHTAPARRGGSLLPSTPLDRRMLLVLDMDETLLHADVSPVPHDVSFVVHMDNGSSTPVYVKFRPYLGRFLNAVSRLFEVVVFTASIPRYANQVLDYIDPSGELVHHRLFREHCTEVNGTYVKDLERLGRPLGRVAIVDNSPVAYTFHPENAVAIPSWYDCERDNALQRLLPHLERMARDEGVYDSLDDIRRELQWD